jgi:hypothetical protein
MDTLLIPRLRTMGDRMSDSWRKIPITPIDPSTIDPVTAQNPFAFEGRTVKGARFCNN